MTERCTYIKLEGGRCRGVAVRGSDLCAAHHPDTQARRRAGARRGGRARGVEEMRKIQREIRDVIDGVLSGQVERGVGSCAAQLYNTLIRAAEAQRRQRELDEMQERLEALEDALTEAEVDRRRWGA